MKRVKACFRKCISVLLLSLTLSLTVANSYQQGATAYATGLEPAIEYFIEMLLASMGAAFGHTSDLKNFSGSFEFYIDDLVEQMIDDPESTIRFYSARQVQQELAYVKSVGLGESFNFNTVPALTSLGKAYILENLFGTSSTGSYDSLSLPSEATYQDFSDTFLNGQTIYYSSNGSDASKSVIMPYDGAVILSNKSTATSKVFYIFPGPKAVRDNCFCGFFLGTNSSGIDMLYGEYYDPTFKSYYYITPIQYTFYPKNEDIPELGWSCSYKRLSSGDIRLDEVRDMYCKDLPVYESFSEFDAVRKAKEAYPYASGACYGLTSLSYILPDSATVTTPDITARVQEVVESNPDLTKEELDALVSNSIADAMAEIGAKIDENQEVTEGWLSRIFDSVNNVLTNVVGTRVDISSIKSSISSLDSSVSSLNSSVSGLDSSVSGLDSSVSAVSSAVNENQRTLDNIVSDIAALSSSITDGSSALELPEEMTDSFTVIEGGGGKTDPDDDSEGNGKYVWFPNAVGIAKLLEPLLDYFTEPFQKVTQALDELVGIGKKILSFPAKIAEEIGKVIEIPDLGDIIEILTDFPMKIAEAFGLEIPLNKIIELLQAIPSSIGNVLGNLELPISVSLPVPQELLDIADGIFRLPAIITDAVGAVFTFDISVVEVAADDLTDTFELKFPFIPVITDMLDLSFPDTYDYPVFKIQTPDAIKQFWKEDYIILFDGKNYATHFLAIRTLLGCLFWLRFIYSLLNHFKVQLHIG